MPGRSPRRSSPPPPPHISHHSSSRGGARSPDRHLEMAADHGRDRREYRQPILRRSHSPLPVRSFSPQLKRKASPIREKEVIRRTKLSRSPVNVRADPSSEHRPYASSSSDSHIIRTVSENSKRFVDKNFEEVRSVDVPQSRVSSIPQFRGPEGNVDFDLNELKKFTIEIIRKPSSANDDSLVHRNLLNPDNVVPVRRPGMRGRGSIQGNKGSYQATRGSFQGRRGDIDNKIVPPPHWTNNHAFPNNHEGARPLFSRHDVASTSNKDRSLPPEDYRRVVNIDASRDARRSEPDRSLERSKYSSYEDNHQHYYREREPSPYETRRRSPPREEYFENRNKLHERAGSSREEFRRDDGKRKIDRKYPDRSSYERESDLRTRINEKRDPPIRPDEREHVSKRYEIERERPRRSHELERVHVVERERREPGRSHEVERERVGRSHEMDRKRPVVDRERPGRSQESVRSRPREMERERSGRGHEMDRERHGERPRPRSLDRERDRPSRSHHSSPPSRERRRPDAAEVSRDRSRGEGGDSGERRRRHSRERDDRPSRSSDHYEDKRFKADSDSKKDYKNYEEKEFSSATRGRGGPSLRRGGFAPMIRGRGMVRGIPRFPRGVMVLRGIPRPPPPFMPIPRFPPRFYPPPY